VSISVTSLSLTPVKGTRISRVAQIDLRAGGATGDRAFYLIDEHGRMLNGKVLGELNGVISELGPDGHLRLRFPDGAVVEGHAAAGEPVETRFYSLTREERLVDGPWSEALTAYLHRPVRLVQAQAEQAVDRGAEGGVSVISCASLTRLAAEGAVDGVDARRFRMLVEIDGVDAHAEDAWVGRRFRIGPALVHFHGHVGRCLITSRDPETGVIDLPTLDILGAYRGDLETTEPLPFGIYGEVLEPGVVSVGDAVSAAD
jgi:uncharacterized protein